MRVVDMHCDTILELLSRDLKGKEASLYSNDLSIDLEKMKKGNYLLQNFALFTDQKELYIRLVILRRMIKKENYQAY